MCLKITATRGSLNSKAIFVIAASLAPFFGEPLAWGFKRRKTGKLA